MKNTDSAYKTILHAANCSAHLSNRDEIHFVDYALGLYQLRNQPEFQEALANIEWPSDVILYSEVLTEKPDIKLKKLAIRHPEVLRFEDGLSQTKYDPQFMVPYALYKLINESILSTIEGSKSADEVRMSKRIDVLYNHNSLLNKTKAIRSYIDSRMVGNRSAIDALVNGWVRTHRRQFLADKPHKGPLGVFTFAGAPGSGKSYLAQLFGEALSRVDDNNYQFVLIDCTRLASESNFWYLTGLSSGFESAKAGELTSRVQKNPYSIILFDELEKMSTTSINILLRLLNEGELKDEFTEQVIDFSKTFIVFTTNLGREIFEGNEKSNVYSNSQSVFEVLRTSELPRTAKNERDNEFLPSEFVSRLERGEAVWFPGLNGRDLLTLLSRTTNKVMLSLFDKVEVDEEFLLAGLLTMLPNISARKVTHGSFSNMLEDLLNSLISLMSSNFSPVDIADSINLHISVGEKITNDLQQLFADNTLDIALVDLNSADNFSNYVDLAVNKFISENSGAQITYQKYIMSPSDDTSSLLENLMRLQSPLILLDLSTGIPKTSEHGNHERTLQFLELIKHKMPDAAVFCFGRLPKGVGESYSDEVKARVAVSGGAREVVLFSNADGVLADSITQSLTSYRLEKIFHGRERLGKSLEFLPPVIDFDRQTSTISVVFESAIDSPIQNAQDVKAGIVNIELPKERFSDVAGLRRAKNRLKQVINLLRDPTLLNTYGIKPPKGFLLSGPPGTGKTLLARALAGEAGLPFFSLSVGDLIKAENPVAQLRQYFSVARRVAPSLLFLDEIDAIALSRNIGRSSTLLNELLTQIDGFNSNQQHVFLLAATNVAHQLDEAICRPGRFDEIIPIDLPEASARREFFKNALKTRMSPEDLADDKYFDRLIAGTTGLTPAQMDRIVREAIYMLIAQGSAGELLDWETLEEARTFVRFGAKQTDIQDKNEHSKHITALHEAGHAIAALALFGPDSVDYVTIVQHESGAAGFMAWDTQALTENLNYGSRLFYRNRLVVALAGRAAEYINSGHQIESFSSGASSDLEQATQIAYNAIARFGMANEETMTAIHALPDSFQHVLGKDVYEQINQWIKTAFDQAVRLLEENQKLHQALTSYLLEKESIYSTDIQEILNKNPLQNFEQKD